LPNSVAEIQQKREATDSKIHKRSKVSLVLTEINKPLLRFKPKMELHIKRTIIIIIYRMSGKKRNAVS